MIKSETIGKLAEALSKAQGAMKNAVKDSENPFFHSKYADLAAVTDACRAELSANGLSVVQLPTMRDGKMVLVYMLLHASGEFIGDELEMTPVKSDPQGIGSAITYARRYTLSGLTGVATEDDDGNAASGKSGKSESHEPRSFTKPATANKVHGGPTLEEGPKPPAVAGMRTQAETTKAVASSLKEIAKEAKAILSVKPSTLPEGCIEQGQAANFARLFEDALKPIYRKNASAIEHAWLKKQGIVDGDGNGTAKAILKANFYECREEAVNFAASYVE